MEIMGVSGESYLSDWEEEPDGQESGTGHFLSHTDSLINEQAHHRSGRQDLPPSFSPMSLSLLFTVQGCGGRIIEEKRPERDDKDHAIGDRRKNNIPER